MSECVSYRIQMTGEAKEIERAKNFIVGNPFLKLETDIMRNIPIPSGLRDEKNRLNGEEANEYLQRLSLKEKELIIRFLHLRTMYLSNVKKSDEALTWDDWSFRYNLIYDVMGITHPNIVWIHNYGFMDKEDIIKLSNLFPETQFELKWEEDWTEDQGSLVVKSGLIEKYEVQNENEFDENIFDGLSIDYKVNEIPNPYSEYSRNKERWKNFFPIPDYDADFEKINKDLYSEEEDDLPF